ncbi:hypothetical protein DOTSEDRAFT_29637 [Dothistroma septosporum NZE10]|uniref:Uncharacterized protein n=1 Tax=Dothistroma septosporum (strain NZE10 / CBS 128990) TaxID=675120 RepID=M2YHN4_DOTSN|nr:hypothetical protein DOTSEDRAFT_29637 [Dothistroma septosporum NZE10]
MRLSQAILTTSSVLASSTALFNSAPSCHDAKPLTTLATRGEPTAAPTLTTRIITTIDTITPTSLPLPTPKINPLATLDPARPTRGLAFAIQRYSDDSCATPIGPRFAYDADQESSCFFKKKHCRGFCGYMDHDEFGSPRWVNKKGTLPRKLLQQYGFGSWDYVLVPYEDVWNAANKSKFPKDKIMFNEKARTGTSVCSAVFYRNNGCRENWELREEGVVGRWKPTHLRIDEGRCMGAFKTPKGVKTKAESFKITCWD